MKLNLDKFKKFADEVLELGAKINEGEKVTYAQTRDIRKAAQAVKVEAQNIRLAASKLNK